MIAEVDFFQDGGTLDPDSPSYITRPADEALRKAVQTGNYCNVLTARQMGKSSLMARTNSYLQAQGIRTVVIDLSDIGTQVNAEQWYFGLINRFKRQLDLKLDEMDWWAKNSDIGLAQRFSEFLRLVLAEIPERIVVFVDEIDTTLSLGPFTDDFFTNIRAAYNARPKDPEYERLTFVLLGVARPMNLIKKHGGTPYNIGRSIPLQDFTLQDAEALLPGLRHDNPQPPEQAKAILEQILYWTDGHPYLTQKLCKELTASDGPWSSDQVDKLVERLFFSEVARRKEPNLQFIRDYIQKKKEDGEMLRLYGKIYAGQRVQDDEKSAVKSELKLAGLVKTNAKGDLVVRNLIYARVFDAAWIQENLPEAFIPQPAKSKKILFYQPQTLVGVAILALFVMGISGYFFCPATPPPQPSPTVTELAVATPTATSQPPFVTATPTAAPPIATVTPSQAPVPPTPTASPTASLETTPAPLPSTATATLTQTPVPLIATPTPSPVSLIIYVQSIPEKRHDLGVVRVSGDTFETKSSLQIHAAAPTWCKDELAFFSEEGGELVTGIWLAKYNNRQLNNFRLLDGTNYVKSLACSPQGDKLAYNYVTNPGDPLEVWRFRVRVIYTDPDHPKFQIGDFEGKQPAWRGNNTLIVNTCQGSICGLFSVDCISSSCNYQGRRQVTNDPDDSFPALSPDGKYLAFASKRGNSNSYQIYYLDFENKDKPTQKTFLNATSTTPIFSPDSRQIFFRSDFNGSWDIWVIDRDGENISRRIKQGVGEIYDDWGLARPAIRQR